VMGQALAFAQPEWVWVLWAWLVLVAGMILLERRGSDVLDRLVATPLRSRLVDRPSRWRRWARIALLGAAGALLALALMRPQTGERFVSTPRVGAEIMVALDVSRSMLADDAKPSRLERAKAELRDLLGYLGDDHVGVIAFAGRASVLSPMTPDKSFLRLALDGAGPHSVPRGGTKLGEAIRRAVVGFGPPGPAQRALILITDGEDHDSFALDAARAAAEAGVKIIAIGFGDEGGSPIFVTDPETGARMQVRDGSGSPVISRLDGDLLRELALATDGAFVPAGTGVLDLASIYDAHIAPLTRGEMDDRGRTIRDEAYPFFLVGAFLCLLAGVLVTGGGAGGRSRSWLALGMLVVASSLFSARPLAAQPSMPQPGTEESGGQAVAPSEAEPSSGSAAPAETPRARFNRANAALVEGEAVAATALLRASRRDAPDDPELRYAATYNLGMAAVARADADSGGGREDALAALHEAADWFREAVGLRPDERAPRHNLEVTLRRAQWLADEIAREEGGTLEEALDAEAEAQRGRVAAAAALLEEVSRGDELESVERLRPVFRDAATEQRVALSRVDELADRVVRERETILARPEPERTPEDALRAAQLEGVLVYLDGALDRMGQTRRQLRQGRAERAYRRGSAALGELKRARDQLRDPVEQIGVLLEETRGVAASTAALLGAELPVMPGGPTDSPALPAFLTPESHAEEVRRLDRRTAELAGRLTEAATQAQAATNAPSAAAEAGAPGPEDAAALAEALRVAAPRVEEAAHALERASDALDGADFAAALGEESAAGEELIEAQEAFFDLTRLLEVTHRDALRAATIAQATEPEIVEAREELAPFALGLLEKDLTRAARLASLLARARVERIAALEASPEEAKEGEPDPIRVEGERFDTADQLLALAEGALRQAGEELVAAPRDWAGAGESARRAADHLDEIRTLFFSLVEHLRALAREQVDLSDATLDAIALAATEETDEDVVRAPGTMARARAIRPQQSGLEERAGAIADVLLAESESPPSEQTEGADEQRGARLRRAAEHVARAQLAMQDAEETLEDAEAPLDPVAVAQGVAVEELAAALELLSPPPDPQEQEQEGQDEKEEEQESSGDGDESPPEPERGDDSAQASETPGEPEASQEEDPSQLLQGVRDREAERRRAQERSQQRRRSAPVDRDW